MKKLLLLIFLNLFLLTKAQFCGISGQETVVYNQADLDVVSGCVNFQGSLTIFPNNEGIIDLSPLYLLESVENNFNISLTLQSGFFPPDVILPNLNSVGGELSISDVGGSVPSDSFIQNIYFPSLDIVYRLYLGDINAIDSLNFDQLTTVEDALSINCSYSNPMPQENPWGIYTFNNLQSIGGTLYIRKLEELNTIDGFYNLSYLGGNVEVTYNGNLNNCCVLMHLANLTEGSLMLWDNGDNCSTLTDIYASSNAICSGCNDALACNYNPSATTDDGSCEYPEEGYDCNGLVINGDTECEATIDSLQNVIDAFIYGDVNCDGEINSQDAALILQYTVGLIEYEELCD